MQKQSSYNVVVVVPIMASQLIHIPLILMGFDSQTIKPSDVVFVYDRCESIEPELVGFHDYRVHHIISPPVPDKTIRGGSFFVGYIKNIGIDWCYANIPAIDSIILIDGDCIPQPELVQSHDACWKHPDIPILSCGKRREKQYGWRDRRERISELQMLGVFRRDIIINDSKLIKDGLITWGCNLALNQRAMRIIKRMNIRYYNDDAIFNSTFDGMWGGEDVFMGVMAFAGRVIIHMPAWSGVEHIEHPVQPQQIQDNATRYLNTSIDRLRILMRNDALPISFFSNP